MKKYYKRILAPFVLMILLMVFVVGNANADFFAVNSNTGYDSDNETVANSTNSIEITSDNSEDVNNSAEANGETGNNSSDDNTGKGTVDTGMLDLVGGFVNSLNLNLLSMPSMWLSDLLAGNDTTGAESDNEASSLLNNLAEFFTTNLATIFNGAGVTADTGDNSADDNTGGGEVKTGDAKVDLTQSNQANSDLLELGDDHSFDFSAMTTNDTTGAESDNEAEINVDQEMTAVSINNSSLDNEADVEVETGDNSSSGNTGDAKIDTGNGEAKVKYDNRTNLTHTKITFDAINSMVSAINSTTGYDSDNEAEIDIGNLATVNNENDSTVDNNVGIEILTGGNEADDNTGDAEIKTGDAKADVQIKNGNSDNQNQTEINFNFGSADLNVGNDTTGADSDNEAEATIGNEVDVTNVNSESIANNVVASLNTGDNSSSDNTGNGKVDSGDAKTTATIENHLNYNTTAVNFSPDLSMDLTNHNTGSDSDNESSAEVNNSVSVTNTNTATVVNNIATDSNTGSNSSDGNTGNGSVTTGGATISFGVQNSTNGNGTSLGN